MKGFSNSGEQIEQEETEQQEQQPVESEFLKIYIMPPYVSDSQRKMFHVLEKQGKIEHKTVAEFDSASKGKKLPDHVKDGKPKRDYEAVRKIMKKHNDK